MEYLTKPTSLIFLCSTIFIFSFFPSWAWSKPIKGQVIVLEAPLFAKKDINSPVVQYVRKGDLIYIHSFENRGGARDDNEEIEINVYQQILDDEHLKRPLDELRLDENFYVTADNLGRTAFIPKKYVKLLYEDGRELEDLDLSEKDRTTDETDYRIQEPLPPNYPLPAVSGYRGFLTLGLGTPSKESYPYPTNVTNLNYGQRFETFATVLRHSKLNEEEGSRFNQRFFFGGMGLYSLHRNQFQTEDFRTSSEDKTTFGIGPCLAYDVFQTLKDRVTILGGGLFNYTNINVKQIKYFQEVGGNIRISGSRHFSGPSLTSRVGLLYQRAQVFPDIDLVLGATMDILFPYKLKPKNPTKNFQLWNSPNDDYIENYFDYQASFIVGLQSSF